MKWNFRKNVGAGILAGLAGAAMAGSVQDLPSDLARQFQIFKLQSASIEDGVLRVIFPKPVVRKDAFRSIVQGYCAAVGNDPKKAWGGQHLRRIEVLNEVGRAGVAFEGGKRECVELDKMRFSDRVAPYIEKRTLVCVAGNPCRERRPNEVTAMDE